MFSSLFCFYIILNFCLTSGYTSNVLNNVNVTILSGKSKESNVFKNRTDDWMIKGGEEFSIANNPWVVSIKVVTDVTVNGYPFIRRCTGSFIAAPKYFLTAARCLLTGKGNIRNFVEFDDILILYADDYRNRGKEEWTEIASFNIPIKYKGNLLQNPYDIALIESVKDIIEGPKIKHRPIITATETKLLNQAIEKFQNYTTYGFGQDPDKYTDRVNKINGNLLRYKECQTEATSNSKKIDEKHQVCAKTVGGGPCAGDEGGSLNVPKTFPDKIVGVYSFNMDGCGTTGVYIRLDPHATWIVQFLTTSPRSTKSKSKSIASLLSPHLGFILAVLFLEIIALKNYLN